MALAWRARDVFGDGPCSAVDTWISNMIGVLLNVLLAAVSSSPFFGVAVVVRRLALSPVAVFGWVICLFGGAPYGAARVILTLINR